MFFFCYLFIIVPSHSHFAFSFLCWSSAVPQNPSKKCPTTNETGSTTIKRFGSQIFLLKKKPQHHIPFFLSSKSNRSEQFYWPKRMTSIHPIHCWNRQKFSLNKKKNQQEHRQLPAPQHKRNQSALQFANQTSAMIQHVFRRRHIPKPPSSPPPPQVPRHQQCPGHHPSHYHLNNRCHANRRPSMNINI